MAAKEKIPSWFNQHSKPDKRYAPLVRKTLVKGADLNYTTITNGEEIILEPGKRYRLDLDYETDYGGCYYSGDTPNIIIKAQLVEFTSEPIPNPRYKQEQASYDEYMDRIKTWDHWKAVWDEQNAKKKELAERRLYLKLKGKYDKGN
jgi:hypothetical protein